MLQLATLAFVFACFIVGGSKSGTYARHISSTVMFVALVFAGLLWQIGHEQQGFSHLFISAAMGFTGAGVVAFLVGGLLRLPDDRAPRTG